jgi:hypothetical protein
MIDCYERNWEPLQIRTLGVDRIVLNIRQYYFELKRKTNILLHWCLIFLVRWWMLQIFSTYTKSANWKAFQIWEMPFARTSETQRYTGLLSWCLRIHKSRTNNWWGFVQMTILLLSFWKDRGSSSLFRGHCHFSSSRRTNLTSKWQDCVDPVQDYIREWVFEERAGNLENEEKRDSRFHLRLTVTNCLAESQYIQNSRDEETVKCSIHCHSFEKCRNYYLLCLNIGNALYRWWQDCVRGYNWISR